MRKRMSRSSSRRNFRRGRKVNKRNLRAKPARGGIRL